MFAIQIEDNIHEEIDVLSTLAVDAESAFAAMLLAANDWIARRAPEGFNPEIINRPGPSMDIAVGDCILVSYTAHRITSVFSVHGEFGIEVQSP